ncbi:GNAT family N-acetyltransferase [Nocardiopsis ganjiahuensis]|uniref:GNAT family N-acetyltransferase n=1 Tax=Nocardiopsis ganjiahuensis TaxID=239984 RepID=UPI001EF9D698|nr:GNAT family protein [Nocardiopsis ganjiahuensis]
MTDTDTAPGPQRPAGPGVRLVEMTEPVLAALAEGDRETAGVLVGTELGEHFASEEMLWLSKYRLGQLRAVPSRAGWLANVVVDADGGWAVGHAGFHGPPDERRMVEIGYSVVPELRRRGYARATLVELLRRADASPEVATVRASISPDNKASLATIAGFGFEWVGEQWDEIDGLEYIHERCSPRPGSGLEASGTPGVA